METKILEQGKPLSKSIIYKLQRDFFAKKGINAWVNSVPYYITSNVFIANIYAQLISHYLFDCHNQKTLQEEQPIYILELGAGHGKLGFHILPRLFEALNNLNLEHLKICYVLSDFSQNIIDYWMSQPQWQKFIKTNKVDLGIFNAEKPQDNIYLNISKNIISKENIKNPVIAISNYLYDTIIQDAFKIKNNQLFEGQACVKIPSDIDDNDEDLLNKLIISFDYIPVKDEYYKDPLLNQILIEYKEKFKNTKLLFPIGAYQCINNLRAISNNRLFHITGDDGISSLSKLENQKNPHIRFHSSFSMKVNFHAISRYFQLKKGDYLFKNIDEGFLISLFLMDQKINNLPLTKHAFDSYANKFDAKDFLKIKNKLIDCSNEFDINIFISYMNLTHWDLDCFWGVITGQLENPQEISDYNKEVIRKGAKKLEENFYFIPNDRDYLLDIGRLYHLICDYDKAIDYYYKSIDYYGEQWAVYFNIALSYYQKNELKKSLEFFKKALKFEKESEITLEWIKEIEESLEQ